MNISLKERFSDICHFKRPGDLFIFDRFWPETLENWVKQGAPKQMVAMSIEEQMTGAGGFVYNYTIIVKK